MGPWVKRLSLLWQRLNWVPPRSDHRLGKASMVMGVRIGPETQGGAFAEL